jgi:hypothetical protein
VFGHQKLGAKKKLTALTLLHGLFGQQRMELLMSEVVPASLQRLEQ